MCNRTRRGRVHEPVRTSGEYFYYAFPVPARGSKMQANPSFCVKKGLSQSSASWLREAKNLLLKIHKTFRIEILRNEVPQDDKTVNVLRQPLFLFFCWIFIK